MEGAAEAMYSYVEKTSLLPLPFLARTPSLYVWWTPSTPYWRSRCSFVPYGAAQKSASARMSRTVLSSAFSLTTLLPYQSDRSPL